MFHLVGAEREQKGPALFRSSVVSSPYLVPMGSCEGQDYKVSLSSLISKRILVDLELELTDASLLFATFQDQFHRFSAGANCTDDLECLRRAPTALLQSLDFQVGVFDVLFFFAGSIRADFRRRVSRLLSQFKSILQPGRPSAYEPCIEKSGSKNAYLLKNTAQQLLTKRVAGVSAPSPLFPSSPSDSILNIGSLKILVLRHRRLQHPRRTQLRSQDSRRSSKLDEPHLSFGRHHLSLPRQRLAAPACRRLDCSRSLPCFSVRRWTGQRSCYLPGRCFRLVSRVRFPRRGSTKLISSPSSSSDDSPATWLVQAFPKTGYRYLYAVTDAVHARGELDASLSLPTSSLPVDLSKLTSLPFGFSDNAYEFPIKCSSEYPSRSSSHQAELTFPLAFFLSQTPVSLPTLPPSQLPTSEPSPPSSPPHLPTQTPTPRPTSLQERRRGRRSDETSTALSRFST